MNADSVELSRLHLLRRGGTTKRWAVAVENIGTLEDQDGWLSAGDPSQDLADAGAPPRLTHQLRPGKYPLYISVAQRRGSADRRIAAVILEITEADSVLWEKVPLSYEGPKAPTFDAIAVDSAHAYLGAYEAARSIALNGRSIIDVATRVRQQESFDWGEALIPGSGNVFFFSSGMGDGSYPIRLGHAADGSPACLLLDFLLV